MIDAIMIFVTVGSEEEAVKIGKALVEERLVACANIVPRIRSIYRWKGEIYDEQELLIVMKTRSTLYPAVEKRTRELHGYEVPEIIAFPIAHGLPDYLRWITDSTEHH